jgi:hypothetical protein
VFNRRVRLFNRYPFTLRLNFYSKLSFRLVFAIIVTVTSIYLTHKSSSDSEEKANQQIRLRDSTNRKHTDSLVLVTSDSLNRTFIKALNEYYLTYNADQKEVRSLLRDSLDNQMLSLDMYLVKKIEYSPNVDSFSFVSVTSNTGNCIITATYKIYSAFISNGNLTAVRSNFSSISREMAVNHVDSLILTTHYYKPIIPDLAFFLVLGTYTNGKTNKPIDILFEWSRTSNIVGTPTEFRFKDSIENIIVKSLHLRRPKRK